MVWGRRSQAPEAPEDGGPSTSGQVESPLFVGSESRLAAAQGNVRKVRIHKVKPAAPSAAVAGGLDRSELNARMDRAITELIPGIADLAVEEPSAGALSAAAAVRERQQARLDAAHAEERELGSIFDIQTPHPGDLGVRDPDWVQMLRPRPRKVQLSSYDAEMINYQRMLLRKNIWYYRDRLSVPRGPCPLHLLKDAWVQGVIDENTLVWGQGLYDWLPAKNVKLLLPMVRTPEVRLGAWIKRTFSLKPALNRVRDQRKEFRDKEGRSQQVERMR